MSIYQEVLKNKVPSKPGDPAIAGKWMMEQSAVNGKEVPANAWQTDPGIWATIYFFNARYCAIGSNPYYFDRTKRNFGEYSLDTSKHLLDIHFFNTKDSLHAWIEFLPANRMHIKGLLGRDTINLQLRKVKM